MRERIAKLLQVKSIVTLMVVGVYCYLALKGVIKADNFTSIVVMIMTYFFTKKSETETEKTKVTTSDSYLNAEG